MTPLPDHQPSTKSTHVSKWQLLRQSSAAQEPTHQYPAAPKKVDLGVTAEGWRGCTIRCPPPRTITAHCVASLASPSNCAPHSAALASASVLACWCLRETHQQGQTARVGSHGSHPSHLAFQRGSLRERAAPDQPSSAMLERKSSSKGWENDDEMIL